jgi:hypothetical protein
MPDLPLVDIAWRRARDAARPFMAGVPATVVARIPAGALVADEETVAVPVVPELAAVVAVNPALPVVLIARRRASARSRELMLLAVCAIVNPVA